VTTDLTAKPPSAAEIVARLEALHRVKATAYGNAWRKRGEMLSVFPNLARKYDRLEVASDRGELDALIAGRPDETAEPLLDTLADLFNYAVKYVNLLDGLNEGLSAEIVAFDAECRGLITHASSARDPSDLTIRITQATADLETLLREKTATPEQKKSALRQISLAALGLLVISAGAAPAEYARFLESFE
jgi:hypothetical protein